MPTTKALVKGGSKIPLSSVITPSSDFVRSSNVERDSIDSEFRIPKYVLDDSVIDVVKRVTKAMTNQPMSRAFSITGSYGSGKSALAVFLNSLLSASKSPSRKQAHKMLEMHSSRLGADLIAGRKLLNATDKGFIRCVVTSRSEPIIATIVRALDHGARAWYGSRYQKGLVHKGLLTAAASIDAAIKQGSTNMPDPVKIVEIVKEMCVDAPVFILLDEFGKNLEYFTHSGGVENDLFIIQQLAEASTGKKGIPLFIMTMQHMAFEEYSAEISTSNKKEWAKIQGRFEDMPFSNSPQQTRNLVANFLVPNQKRQKERNRIKIWADAKFKIMKSQLENAGITKDQIARCYPMHPLSLTVLPELCSRYGQHERTLLSFITSGETNSIPEFIDNTTMPKDGVELPNVGLDVLYDYFIAEHRSVHMTHSPTNMSRMMEIYLNIRDSNDLSVDELKVLKTIGLLNLLGTSGMFSASSRVLEYALGAKIDSVIRKLRDKSIITYRKHSDEYRVWRGSDIDIQSDIHNARMQLKKIPLADIMSSIKKLDPIIASKHAITKGTMRIFECAFMDSRLKTRDLIQWDADGLVLFNLDNKAVYKIPSGDRPAIVVLPQKSLKNLRDAAEHTAAINEVLSSNPNIANDLVARAELNERKISAMNKVNEEWDEVFGYTSQWVHFNSNGSRKDELLRIGSAGVSEAANSAYNKSPIIFNEMVNRSYISTQASRGRNILINSMIKNVDKEHFGIVGWGPERAMYESIFRKTKLHRKKGKVWKLDIKESNINQILTYIEYHIKNSKKQTNLDSLYADLRKPPYGIKTGLMFILIMIVIHSMQNYIALYEHGTLRTSLAPEIIERIAKNPAHFSVKYFGENAAKKRVFIKALGKNLKIEPTSSVGFMDVITHLVYTVAHLDSYSKHTKLSSKDAVRMRDAILEAVEPDVMLFETIPKSLEKPHVSNMVNDATLKLAKKIALTMDEIVNMYSNLLVRLREDLYAILNVEGRQQVSHIAADLKIKTSDNPYLQGIFNALESSHLDDDDWIIYFSTVLVNSPTSGWTDKEYQTYTTNLREFSDRTKRMLALYKATLTGKTYDNLRRIAVTQPNGDETVDVIMMSKSQNTIATSIAETVLDTMGKNKSFKDRDDLRKSLISALSSMK